MKIVLVRNFVRCFSFMAVASLLFSGCGNSDSSTADNDFARLAQEIEGKVKPLYNAMALAYFDATVSGEAELYEKAALLEMDLNKVLSDRELFKRLQNLEDSGRVTDPLKKRHVRVLYLAFLANQVDTDKLDEITRLQTEIQQKYDTYRAVADGREVTDNEVESILSHSRDSQELKAVWMAHKAIGPAVAADIIRLVKMRNAVAVELGFTDYHEMSLKLSEQEPEDIENIFDELDALTAPAFVRLKREIDRVLSARYAIRPEDMMPWHYQNRYFQEAPNIYEVNLDAYYADQDLIRITGSYYASLGLPIDDILSRSDLFEKPGKYQHAYCININRETRDIRVVGNVVPDKKWMDTMLHEYGHALYEKHLAAELPWHLKSPAHIFVTEAVAMMFGRFSSNANWMKDMLGISDHDMTKLADSTATSAVARQLVFSRWSQVMYRFEKSLYADPDQDLNALWWDLAEKYQGLKRPEGRNEPDWATKIHIATSPCYYHNYLLGELLASQLYFTICEKVVHGAAGNNPGFFGRTEVGEYLIRAVFSAGARYAWNDMIERATGERLTAKYYAKQFVQ